MEIIVRVDIIVRVEKHWEEDPETIGPGQQLYRTTFALLLVPKF